MHQISWDRFLGISVYSKVVKMIFIRLRQSIFALVSAANYRLGFRRDDLTYVFSLQEILLFIREQTHPSRKVAFSEAGSTYLTFEEFGRKFYWPKMFPAGGLAWMRDEVFVGFERNPSSYSYPKFNWEEVSWVIDGGACEGFFSHLAIDRGVKKVLPVEPVEQILDGLKLAFESEVRSGRVDPVQGALDVSSGTSVFEVNAEAAWESKITIAPDDDAATSVTRVWSIDDLAAEKGLSGRGLIKMDIEGGEVGAIKGAATVLRDSKPYLAIAVYHEYQNAALVKAAILDANPEYAVEFRGFYGWEQPPRPYMCFAH